MTEQDPTERLYGLPGAEDLYFDPAGCYEAEIEPYGDGGEGGPYTVEEWTVHPPGYHFPSVDVVLDWLVDWTAENGEITERVDESFERAIRADEARDAVGSLLDLIASKVTGRMADRMVATHSITRDEAGEPLLDGEPLYRKRLKCGRCNGTGLIQDVVPGHGLTWGTITCPDCVGSGSVGQS